MSYYSHLVFEYFQTPENLQKPYLIICDHQKEAEQLRDDLEFFQTQGIPIHVFPDWETLAYDPFSPHQDIISERLNLLYDLINQKPMVLIVSLNTLLHRLTPKTFLLKHVFRIQKSQKLPLSQFKDNLIAAQYKSVSTVQEHGEFSSKGSIMDVFPMGGLQPIRIEWFDDEIESIRWFDVQTQLSHEKIDELQLLPAKEFSLDEDSVREFRQRYREQFPGNPNISVIYEHVSNQQEIQGLEYFLPLFFDKTETLFDYLPPKTKILYSGQCGEHIQKLWQEISIRYEQRRHDVSRPILKPEQLFLSQIELEEFIHQAPNQKLSNQFDLKLPEVQIDRKSPKPLKKLKAYLDENIGHKIFIIASSLGRREVIHDLCKSSDIFPEVFDNTKDFIDSKKNLGLVHGPLAETYYFKELNILCITEHELFGETIVYQKQRRKKTISSQEKYIKDLSELSQGMPVVHVDYGVGRYEGLQSFEFDGIKNEFLMIRYAGDDKIYVPVTHLNLISKYSGTTADQAPIHKLGAETWQKEKKKASEKVHDMAVELLETQALRSAQLGFSYHIDWPDYERFTSAFRFVETDDQKNAIEAIIKDLQSSQPMDRLICGDVGFGKTEVAMRAAFLVVQNHRQVCILVPTTLLAKQHFETFQERFADFPICVELISRFRTKKESQSVIERLKEGKVDILIGTHKLLQQDVEFKDLGMLIIDEEHRFGVKQKEHLKKMKHQADILSLTATPIPRTLNMAMHGMRDISIISTPPAKRLAIKTFWNEKHPQLLREAILREILRGGQVYYLHNDIQSIEKMTQELKTLIPEAKVEYAHGQMHERRLEQIMADFYHQRFNVLVCTTIIETGIDIPTANTMIIERADQLGLAQLHQLRGRVGRSHHQAYAYLLTPPENLLSNDAKKRLEAIVSLEDLGAGFTLAMHDMEIRGAGEFLGEEQSGNLHAVGYSLYMEMLEQAVEDIKAGKIPDFEKLKKNECEIDLKISSIIPEDYMPDIHQRLVFYKRIASAKTEDELHHLQIELIDRFGLLPKTLKTLIAMTYLKFKAIKLGIKRILFNKGQGIIEFIDNPPIEPIKIILLIQQLPQTFKLKNPSTLQFNLASELDSEELVHQISEIILKFE
jgi:transcription-repair coupling factor (superfamily II helicase)